MKTLPSISRYQLVTVAIVVILVTPAFMAGRLSSNHFDYESCAEFVASISDEENTFTELFSNCGNQYVGRRSERGGYIYKHPVHDFSVELKGPNPTASEWEGIDAAVKLIVAENLQQSIERAERLKIEREREERRQKIAIEKQRALEKQRAAERAQRDQCIASAEERWTQAVEVASQRFEKRDIKAANKIVEVSGVYLGATIEVAVKNTTNLSLESWRLNYNFISRSEIIDNSGNLRKTFSCPTVLNATHYGYQLDPNADQLIKLEATVLDSAFNDPIGGICYHVEALKFVKDKRYIPNCYGNRT